ncbi:hypothetical protein RN001_015110 [Aquatica leii]|uniref:Uncharacterized protein n=1 Tax=Aquatica leii TaxID=1421715 RepID=A0AAN7P2W9_9COLE|nr:hypothetical protein RN001_015110 [Aquatica leii]
MDFKFLLAWFWVVGFVIFGSVRCGGHKHIKIYVPYKVKTIKHTHTIYKTIHHKDDHGHGGKDSGGSKWS